ncbi:hypothetical protein AA0Z99_12840 [Agrococcus sp. 1P02AA]|uniref:hypothetical protein n=1 Tax=Agrococcus sp. 1P02AA TaxID=3132259 RepID=UPI0039A5D23A
MTDSDAKPSNDPEVDTANPDGPASGENEPWAGDVVPEDKPGAATGDVRPEEREL